MSDADPTPAQLAAAHLAVWMALPEARRAYVVDGLLGPARWGLSCVEVQPIGGVGQTDGDLLDRAAANIAAAQALGWTDDGIVARLAAARDLVKARAWGTLPARPPR